MSLLTQLSDLLHTAQLRILELLGKQKTPDIKMPYKQAIEKSTEPPIVVPEPPAAGLTVVSAPAVTDITDTSVKIRHSYSDNCTSLVEIGITTALGTVGNNETSYLYGSASNAVPGHISTIADLIPDTQYYYQIIVVDEHSNEFVSSIETFTTAVAVSPPVTPSIPDYVEPYGGLFIGPEIYGGISTGNVKAANDHLILFRAHRTMKLKTIGSHARFPTDDEAVGRYKGICGDLGITKGIDCGLFQLKYGMGTGGELVATIHAVNDFSTLALGPEIGRSDHSAPLSPGLISGTWWEMALQVQPDLIQGELYAIWIINTKPLPLQYFSSGTHNFNDAVTLTKQLVADGYGAMCMNCIDQTSIAEGPALGPFAGDQAMKMYYKLQSSDAWKRNTSSIDGDPVPYLSLTYEDDSIHGNLYVRQTNDQDPGTQRVVQGSNRARQVIQLARTVIVDGVWVYYQHYSYANGSPMTVTARNALNAVLAVGSIASSDIVRQFAAAQIPWYQNTSAWVYSDLSVPVPLISGETFYIDLSASSGAAFALGSYDSYGSPAEIGTIATRVSVPQNMYARYSEDNGNTWENYRTSKANADIPVILVPQGNPRRLM